MAAAGQRDGADSYYCRALANDEFCSPQACVGPTPNDVGRTDPCARAVEEDQWTTELTNDSWAHSYKWLLSRCIGCCRISSLDSSGVNSTEQL